MKSKGLIFLTIFILIFFLFTQIKLINKPSTDNDEGIYLTSFLLINKGNAPYKKTYFSQPPGFLLSVYPGFLLLGKNLQAARLTISLWSLVGLVAIILLASELNNSWVGLLTVGILSIMSTYFNQSLTFQSDILVTTFSIISFFCLIKYQKKLNFTWFVISIFFLNLAFWTKFDVTFFPSFLLFIYLLFKNKRINLRKLIILLLIAFLVSGIFFSILILPFGIKPIFTNSILLRFQAAKSSSSIFMFFEYLKRDVLLLTIVITTSILTFIKRRSIKYPINIIIVWTFFTLLLLFFYRPLFPHHLVMLAVPMVLLFSYEINNLFKNKKIFSFLVLIVLILAILIRLKTVITTQKNILTKQQEKLVSIVISNSKSSDLVVCDEEIINGISGRLPPPELSDISQVRIRSGSLTANNYLKIIKDYKPKLIIAWNGRLTMLSSFKESLISYQLLTSFSPSKNIYIRTSQ